MKPIATPLGPLNLIEGACEQQIAAELRGLCLLMDIVKESPVWSIDTRSSRPFLVSNDGPPGISVDIFQSMKVRILGGDPHLTIMMAQKSVCVARQKSDVLTPSTDSMVSLVLLGNMGWPLCKTPSTMRKKALAPRDSPEYNLEDHVYYTEQDRSEIDASNKCLLQGKPMEGLQILATMGRRWYVCRGWNLDLIQPAMEKHLVQYSGEQIQRYLEAPECSEDDLFLVL